MAHSDMPLIKVAEALQLNRDLSRTPLFQINFRVVAQPVPALELKNVSAEPAAYVDNGTSKFDLALEIEPTTGKRCYFEYRTDLFREEGIVQMQEDFQCLMQALLTMPEIPIANLKAVLDIRHRLAGR
jgi:non-ribosomal peptide synthetase component F